jgi:hypothetical protein
MMNLINKVFLPFVITHLVINFLTVLFHLWLLQRESRKTIPFMPVKSQEFGQGKTQRILDLSQISQRQNWYKYWLFSFLMTLYFLAFDVFNLVASYDFYRMGMPQNVYEFDNLLIFYVLALVFRTSEQVLSVPTVTDCVLEYYENMFKNFDDLSEFNGSGCQRTRYFLISALKALPPLLTQLFNAAMYFLWTSDCHGYFFCVYSIDHWYQAIFWLSLFIYYIQTNPLISCSNVRFFHILVLLLLVVFFLFSLLAPFLFFSTIDKLTILCTLYYQLSVTGTSCYLLAIHYVPDE